MASPFAIFRRNQQTLLVVLFILAIFAFTLSDLLTSQTVNLPMLGLIIGTCVMTAAGVVMKKPAKYAALGAAGGLLVGFAVSFIATPNAPDTAARTKLGRISEVEVQQLLAKRAKANDFIRFAAQQALGPQQSGMQVRAYSFGITGANDREEAVLSMLLLEEAKRLGIGIDKATVSQYINVVTENKLSKTQYKEVLQAINVTDGQLYQILQEQIAIRMAQHQLAPSGFMTPEQYWEMFEKLNVSQRIQTVAVPVDALTKTVPAPDEGKLKDFFEAHKNNFPGQPNPESVGFRQPRKVQLAYIEASYLDLESTIDPITDAEVEEYYEANKDPYYLNRIVPEDPLGGDPFSGESQGGTTGPDLGNPNTPDPKLDFNSLFPDTKPKSEDGQSESEGKPAPDAPEKSDQPKSSDAPQDGDADKSSDKPELPKLPESGDKPESSEPDSQSLIDRSGSTLQPVSFVQEEKEAPKEESPAASEKAETKAADADKAAESDEKKTEGETSDEPKQEETEGETEKPGSNTLPPAPEADGEAPLRAPKPAPPKFKPLDDLLRDEIRDTLLRQRTEAKQEALAELVLTRMSDMSNDYFNLVSDEADDATMNKFVKDAQTELQALAEKYGLTYQQTDLMSASELSLSQEHPIGSATIGIERSNATTQETVADYAFKESVYEANAARSISPASIYVFWKTADRESHVPTWDEEGIQKEVLEAWRLEQARPKAEERAKQIAEKLRGVDQTWSEYFIEKPETITGEREGTLMQPLISDFFSWMSIQRSSVPTPFGFPMPVQVPRLTQLSTVKFSGPKFMETVFEDMKPGEVGVVPNDDLSVYYVVQIRDRRPSTPEELEFQREQFLKERDLFPTSFLPTPYSMLVNDEGSELYRAWLENLKTKYGVEIYEREEEERS